MKAPGRGTLVAIIFFTFLAFFLGGLAYYLYPLVVGQQTDPVTGEPVEDGGFSFFPFGRGGNTGTNTDTPNNNNDNDDDDQVIIDEGDEVVILPRLRLVADVPVAGAYMTVDEQEEIQEDLLAENDDATNYIIRYIESETGNLYEAESNSLAVERLTNTTIPGVSTAEFVNQDLAILRYLDSNDIIKTFSATYNPPLIEGDEDAVGRLQGIFLDDNIQQYTISSETELFYTLFDGGNVRGILSTVDGRNKTQIFSSVYSEWSPSFGNRSQTITMTTYPSYADFGISYLLSAENQSFRPFINAQRGLMVTLDENAENALVSAVTTDGTELFIRNSDGTFTETGLETFAEKCAWAPGSVTAYCAVPTDGVNANEPDRWYQGVSNYVDDIWKITIETGLTEFVYSPLASNGYRLDIVDMRVSPNDQYLYFLDKQRSYLWTLFLLGEQ